MIEKSKFGTVFDIQHFSLNDGPGIRTTVFLKGCPLHCEWCHNPESYITDTQIMFYSKQCVNCRECAKVCPHNCHSFENDMHLFERTHCVSCGKCTLRCPTGSLKTVGKRISTEDVIKEVLEDKFFYESSEGGVTLSGGEPMFQPHFALDIAKTAKENGLHVCMETSGFCNSEHLEQILPFVDLFLFDYKATGDEQHQKYTGVSQMPILDNLYLIDRLGANIILRCPIIPDRNLNPEHVAGIIDVAGKLSHLLEIHLEPYHNIGISKRTSLGINTNNQMLTPPTNEELHSIAKEIQDKTHVTTTVV